MKTTRPTILLGSLSISIIVLISIFARTTSYAAVTTVSLDPASTETYVGQNFGINFTISNAVNLYGWELRLSWNATILEAVNLTEGPFLNQGGTRQTFFTYNVNSTTGQMIVDCTLLGMVPGVNGTGALSTINFSAKTPGQSLLHFYNVSLIDSNEIAIPYLTTDGTVQVNPPHDVAITQVDVSPTIVLPGTQVNVNVTAQNKGSYNEVFNITVYANSTTIGTQQVSLTKGDTIVTPFTWNTTGRAKGDYIILASASVVPYETLLANNNKTADNPVTILTQGHDLAVIIVKPTKNIVGQGYTFTVEVKVGDYGTYSETFNVTLYLNTTAIGTQTTSLTSGAKAIVAFTIDSSTIPKSWYTVGSTAGPVTGETQTNDNTLDGGLILITIPGDINGDKAVDIFDAIALSAAFNTQVSSTNWNPNANINGDSAVDIYDAIILSLNFGKKI